MNNPFVNEFGELSSGILLNIAEILTLRLPEGSERVIASKWVKKFLACNPTDYKHNLSLFISCLTKQMLVKPFDVAPEDQSAQWNNFDKEYTAADIHREVKQRVLKDAYAPLYKVEIAHDMKEYVTYQEIPFFGAHCYYAMSVDERLDKWQNFNKLNVPKSYVKALQLEDELEESPIKRCKFPKRSLAFPTKAGPRAAASKLKKPAARPGWEGPIPEEEVPPEPEKKTAVSFPTDVPPANIPAKLQKRFIDSARQKEERLQALAEKMKGETPAVGPKGKQRKVPKKVSNRTTPSLGTSKGQTPADTSQKAGTKESSRQALFEDGDEADQDGAGEEVRVPNKFEYYKEFLDSVREDSVKAKSLKQLPDQIKETSDALKTEMRRTVREMTPNTPVVDEIQDQEIEIGEEIAEILTEHAKMNRWERMKKENKIDDPDLKDIRADFRFVDERRANTSGVQVRPETVERLTALKKKAMQIATPVIEPKKLFAEIVPDESLEEFEKLEAKLQAEVVLDVINSAINEATEANENLAGLIPQSEADKQLVSELIRSNNLIVEDAAPSVQKLINDIEKNKVFPRTVINAAGKLNKSFEKSNEIDRNVVEKTPESPVAAHASLIQDRRNIVLSEVATQADEISRIAEETQRKWEQGYVPADTSVRQRMGLSNEIIDLDQMDTDFGDVDIADFLNETRNTRQQFIQEASIRFKQLAETLDEEQLGNIDENFDELFNKSLEKVLNESLEVCEQLQAELAAAPQTDDIAELQAQVEEYERMVADYYANQAAAPQNYEHDELRAQVREYERMVADYYADQAAAPQNYEHDELRAQIREYERMVGDYYDDQAAAPQTVESQADVEESPETFDDILANLADQQREFLSNFGLMAKRAP